MMESCDLHKERLILHLAKVSELEFGYTAGVLGAYVYFWLGRMRA